MSSGNWPAVCPSQRTQVSYYPQHESFHHTLNASICSYEFGPISQALLPSYAVICSICPSCVLCSQQSCTVKPQSYMSVFSLLSPATSYFIFPFITHDKTSLCLCYCHSYRCYVTIYLLGTSDTSVSHKKDNKICQM